MMHTPRARLGALALAATIGCSIEPTPVSTAIDDTFIVRGRRVAPGLINSYLSEHLGFTSRGGEMHCAYTLLGQDASQIYIQSLCLELVQVADSLVEGSGRGGPVALTLAIDGDSVRIASHQVPVDGGGHAASIRRIFPAGVAKRVLDGNQTDTLAKHLRAAARARIGSLHRTDGQVRSTLTLRVE